MMAETKNNSGVLFNNDRKESERHPDNKGKALIDGQWFWVSAWWKQSAKGDFQSLAFEPMTPEQVDQYCGGQRQQGGRSYDDAPGYGGPPSGTGRQNRDARQQQRRPAPGRAPAPAQTGYGDGFMDPVHPDDIPSF